jgi:hypothetical protein
MHPAGGVSPEARMYRELTAVLGAASDGCVGAVGEFEHPAASAAIAASKAKRIFFTVYLIGGNRA